MCVDSEFQVDGAETEKAREVKLLVILEGLARRFVYIFIACVTSTHTLQYVMMFMTVTLSFSVFTLLFKGIFTINARNIYS